MVRTITKNKVNPIEVKEESSFSFFGSSINKSLEEVKENHENTCIRRRQGVQSILLDQQFNGSWWNLMWILPGLVIGATAVFLGFVLVPFENVFHKPEHWYEMMLQCATVGLGKIVQLCRRISQCLLRVSFWYRLYQLSFLQHPIETYIVSNLNEVGGVRKGP